MKLGDLLKDFYTYSGKASDVNRQLAFAGIAAIWVFRPSPTGAQFLLPRVLYIAGTLLICSLACDLMQYFVAALTWSKYHEQKERERVAEDTALKVPRELTKPIFFFFNAKILLLIIGYAFLLFFMVSHILVSDVAP